MSCGLSRYCLLALYGSTCLFHWSYELKCILDTRRTTALPYGETGTIVNMHKATEISYSFIIRCVSVGEITSVDNIKNFI